MAAPRPYDEEIVNEVCDITATSALSLSSILMSQDHYPGVTTFYKWLDGNEDAAKNYARAKESQAHYLVEGIPAIADTPLIGEKIKSGKDGDEITTGDNVDRSRLMIDARKWVAARLLPKKYGDKLDLTSDGDKLNQTVIILPAKDGGSTTHNPVEGESMG
jgi:hypothetical protein